MNEFPAHLLLPLLSSILLVCGLLCVKRASSHGVGPWTITLLANQSAALLFSSLWLLGGDGQPTTKLWQPAIIASLYILGQVFMFSAIHHGDVSVATPVFGVKVIFVATLLAVVFQQTLPFTVWCGAALATMGIGMVQWQPRQSSGSESGRSLFLTIGLALSSATSFACFDVLVQHWAPAWGAGRFLPAVFWMVAILSLGFLPVADLHVLRDKRIRVVLLLGTILIALQALCLVTTLATFGDAARVNVVYSLRGMWGVILAWFVAVTWGGSEATLPSKVMFARLVGAALLTAGVVLVVVARV